MKPETTFRPKPGFAACLALLACVGCSTTPTTTTGAIDTGTYPNLNVPPPVATQQFDGASLQAHNEALRNARADQSQTGQQAAALAAASNAEQARLRQAARSQAATLKAIEAKR